MMDFGMVGGMDSLMVGGGGDGNGNGGLGSGFLKQERSSSCGEDEWRGFKMARITTSTNTNTNTITTPASLLRSNSVLYSDGAQQQQMLSFSSSPTTADPPLHLPYYHPHPHPHPQHHALSAAYSRNAGFGPGSLNTTSMHGGLTGVRGPFTPSQWMELEHQALIYKYINANVPIPSNLLIPIRKALNPSGFTAFGGSLRPNALGWGSFHLGFSGNNDPEPGRCRRTDGKKWRCSRDAVADQKYCERHMNRGRHRSRKPVEGQTGHAASGPATTKAMPMVSSSSASVVSGGSGSNSLAVTQHQVKRVQTSVNNDTNMNSHINRMLLQKENVEGRVQDAQSLSAVSPTMNLKSNDGPFSVLKSDLTFAESRSDFGLISSDSLLNTSQRSSYIDCRNFNSSPDLNEHESRPQDPLRHFIDDWPKNRSDTTSITWPEVEETQFDRTQLSISIPMASSDFSSSSSSPAHEKLTLSPLRLSREFNPIHMGLGVGSVLSNEPPQRQANWIPISWETSMGGPLGEVLNKTNNAGGDCKNSSALNLMTEGWDASSHMELSPTGVLQKAAFGSLSNSSTGSSPRAETNRTRDGGSLCDNLLGSTLVSSSSIPTL